MFARGYHGGSLGFPDGRPGPFNIPHEWVVAPYDDIPGTDAILLSLPPESLAAILVEPMQGAAGCFPASPPFLEYLRRAATSFGAVLIFDEVMTSRLHWGGLQAKLQIKPDMTTLGKYLAGGMSFGAFGGSQDIMDLFLTIGHAGTFNNNIMSMTGGVAAFSVLTPGVLDGMNALGDDLRTGISRLLEATNGRVTITGVGSLMSFHFGGKDGSAAEEAEMARELFFFYMMVEEGVYLANRGFMALSIVHETQHVTRLLQAVERFVERYRELWV